MKAMIHVWEDATKERGKNTQLYEDPDLSIFADKELISALEKKVIEDPNYPVPEGYRKVVEKIPIYTYKLPECVKQLMKDSTIVVTELLDEVLAKALKIHFLEPKVSFEQKLKIMPSISKKVQKAEALGYMKKVEKKVNAESND